MYQQHKNQVDFYWIYIREAHASNGLWPSRKVKVLKHKTTLDRRNAATACQKALGLTIPILIDDMDDTANIAFQGYPDRLYILSVDGTISYRGGRGPWGFKVDKMEKALAKVLKK